MRLMWRLQRVFTTDIYNVLEGRDAGPGNDEGTDRDRPEGIKCAAEQGGWRKVDSRTARHGKVDEGGTATKGLANGKDTGVGLASVADGGDEGACHDDNQAGQG